MTDDSRRDAASGDAASGQPAPGDAAPGQAAAGQAATGQAATGQAAMAEIVAKARASAEEKRAGGLYPPETVADAGKPPAGPDLARLREWAIVEVDSQLVYSTRTGGAPITWFKRLLLRLMKQYTTELEAQQTRFNVGVVAYLESLEKQERE